MPGRGETALEAGRGPRNARRLQGKDDQLDAARAARTVLSSETLGQLNRALHTVILHRRLHDPATRDYIARRVAKGKTREGKARRDAVRLLKPYLARHLYRVLNGEPHMT